VTVSEDGFPYAASVAALAYPETMDGYARASEAERETVRAAGEAAAARLRHAGIDATTEIRSGDPAHQIIASAREHQAGLIVIATRGQTGLRRLILGSVARNVLLYAPCSVLIVRGGAEVSPRNADQREEREPVSASA